MKPGAAGSVRLGSQCQRPRNKNARAACGLPCLSELIPQLHHHFHAAQLTDPLVGRWVALHCLSEHNRGILSDGSVLRVGQKRHDSLRQARVIKLQRRRASRLVEDVDTALEHVTDLRLGLLERRRQCRRRHDHALGGHFSTPVGRGRRQALDQDRDHVCLLENRQRTREVERDPWVARALVHARRGGRQRVALDGHDATRFLGTRSGSLGLGRGSVRHDTRQQPHQVFALRQAVCVTRRARCARRRLGDDGRVGPDVGPVARKRRGDRRKEAHC
mmetsp:Transcript_35124/g.81378  ORF Transcript_35124/g.81378 Transcript_35124/m.81378 type:complete len:275 (+) Transcript_35124:40-864(+)